MSVAGGLQARGPTAANGDGVPLNGEALLAGTTRPATTIRRRARVERAAGFEALRAQGIGLLQRGAGEPWTDHNLHDPGITLLELLCFALTELSYRAEWPVADLLSDAEGRIDYPALALHPAHQAFPCRPTTADDWRRSILDRVPQLDDAHLLRDDELLADGRLAQARQGSAAAPSGVWRLVVKPAAGVAEDDPDLVRAALQAFRAQRPLGEDLHHGVTLMHSEPVELHGDLELSGPQEAIDVLAQLLAEAADAIAGSTPRLSRRELRARGLTLAEVHDGPVALHGFVEQEHLRRDPHGLLHTADVHRRVSAVPGVRHLQGFALAFPGQTAPFPGTLAVPDGRFGLRLVVPGSPGPRGQPWPLRVVVRRRNQPVAIDTAELWHRVQDLQAAQRARHTRGDQLHAFGDDESLPAGRARQPQRYLSVQHHLPAVYGMGLHGVPPSAGARRQAQADQLRGYLALFDQVLANGQAQLAHLHTLFSVEGGARRSCWWTLLGEAEVPGLDALLIGPADTLEQDLMAPLDRSPRRRHQVLDHLLALHGEQLSQNAMRLYCGHLAIPELDALLLDNKRQWLADIVRLSRDRAGGFDDSRPLWPETGAGSPAPGGAPDGGAGGGAATDDTTDDTTDPTPDNTSGLARRVSLLLGFSRHQARPLCTPWITRGIRLDERLGPTDVAPEDLREALQALQAPQALTPPGPVTERTPRAPASPAPAGPAAPATRMRDANTALPAALVRAGVAHDAYRLQQQGAHTLLAVAPTAAGAEPTPWLIGPFVDRGDARAARDAVRATLLALNDDSEGLHLIEHVLLRPLRDDSPGHAALRPPADFFSLAVTAVMPGWTVRTAQAGFRRLAEETLRINTPAHLRVGVVWLEFEPLARFETAYGRWLAARRQWCAAATPEHATVLDHAASAVLPWLLPSRA